MLRPLLFALIAANLLFFAWSQWIATADVGYAPAVPEGAPAAEPAPLVGAAAEPVAAPAGCISLGPFDDAAAAERAAGLLAAAGKTALSRVAETSVPDAYWVYVGPLRDAGEQRRTLNTIKAAGIDDASAMPDDAQFRVSVGLFTDRERADQRAQRVRALRLAPQIEDRFQTQSAWWLDLQGVEANALQTPQLLELGIADSGLGTADCP